MDEGRGKEEEEEGRKGGRERSHLLYYIGNHLYIDEPLARILERL